MTEQTHAPGGLLEHLAFASGGAGPLLQRDYWAVISHSRLSPSEVMALVSQRFAEFAPEELVRFQREQAKTPAIEKGEELDIHIVGAGDCRVRVTHKEPQSFTLSTLEGHPEAGRITFGAYRNKRGDVIFHIRSRARQRSKLLYAAFRLMGDAMQHNTWADFVNRVAINAGDGVIGGIQTETTTLRQVEEEPAEAVMTPTFLAQGD